MTDPPKNLSDVPGAGHVDVLSDVLRVVRLTGASLFRAEFREPFCVLTAHGAGLARAMGSSTRCLVMFHVVMAGKCWVSQGDRRVDISAGDVVILAHGDQHVIGGGGPRTPLAIEEVLPPMPWIGLPDVVHGGGGPAVHLFCGFLQCEAVAFHPLLESLPRLKVVRGYAPDASIWLRSTVELIVHEARARRPGGRVMLERLNEVLLVEALRDTMTASGPPARGWLAGVHDRHVGRALELMHAEPARGWTVPDLARAVGVSRSVLAERFRRLVGQSPGDYLKVWRLHLARSLLREDSRRLCEVAEAVGYESEAAFSKAFRNAFGAPPGTWRRDARSVMPLAPSGNGPPIRATKS